ncbi:MAG: MBL fold metallo-hydrolase [Deltaproteobacteria bacterium]|nr:MBL fold metallo-hydrolase [Deltaproteobacteria bacterium]
MMKSKSLITFLGGFVACVALLVLVGASRSPTRAIPASELDVYYPGTEDLKPDEMRVVALGTGMPSARPKQAAACWLVELGNGDKFLFDLGSGCHERLAAQKIPYDYLDKVFIGHLHVDHMGDLPTFWLGGTVMNRLVPLRIWGPSGGTPEYGTAHAMDLMKKMYVWDIGTRSGVIDFRGGELEVHEFRRHRPPRWGARGPRVPLRRHQRGDLRRERRGGAEHSRGARPGWSRELHSRVERAQVRLRK